MKFVVPYLTKTELIEFNGWAYAQHPACKSLNPDFIRGLDEGLKYPIVQSTLVRRLSCARVTIAFGLDGPFGLLDMPSDIFESLPTMTTTLDHNDTRLPQ